MFAPGATLTRTLSLIIGKESDVSTPGTKPNRASIPNTGMLSEEESVEVSDTLESDAKEGRESNSSVDAVTLTLADELKGVIESDAVISGSTTVNSDPPSNEGRAA